MAKWQTKYPKLCDWVEETIEETLSFYCPPLAHHKHLKATNMLERLNEELKRRTHGGHRHGAREQAAEEAADEIQPRRIQQEHPLPRRAVLLEPAGDRPRAPLQPAPGKAGPNGVPVREE